MKEDRAYEKADMFFGDTANGGVHNGICPGGASISGRAGGCLGRGRGNG